MNVYITTKNNDALFYATTVKTETLINNIQKFNFYPKNTRLKCKDQLENAV